MPKKWRHLRRPCVRLIKALYGHPEAGGHWERHLEKVVVGLGGKRVPNHASCFWFKDTKLLLTIYVDDLLLSGPASEHEAFWAELSKTVSVEPAEDLDRYLGRHHKVEEVAPLPNNLLEHFVSPALV